MRYFEDFRVGDRFELGQRSLSREEIVAFAREWDPQEFHTGERESVFGASVIASGVQVLGAWMRLFVDNVLRETAVVGGKTATLRMLVPVVPGMALHATAEVVAVEESARTDRGVVTLRGHLRDAQGKLLWETDNETVVARAPVKTVVSEPDPQRFTFTAPALTEAEEDALWELDEDGPVVITAIADGHVDVEYRGGGGAEEALALLTAAAPGVTLTLAH